MAGSQSKRKAPRAGLYARHFSRAERAGLRGMDPADLAPETEMLRTGLEKLHRVQMRLAAQVEARLQAGQAPEVEALVQVTHCLARSAATLFGGVRIQAGLRGAGASMQEELAQALAGMPAQYVQPQLFDSPPGWGPPADEGAQDAP